MSTYGQPAMYSGEYYDSRTEATWAAYFDIVGIPYQHEPARFKLPVQNYPYTPDFRLYDDIYAEIKNGNIDPQVALRAHYLARSFGRTVLLIDGMPINMTVYVFGGHTTKKPDFNRLTLNFARDLADYTYYFRPNVVNPSVDTKIIMEAAKVAQQCITLDIDEDVRMAAKTRKQALIPKVLEL